MDFYEIEPLPVFPEKPQNRELPVDLPIHDQGRKRCCGFFLGVCQNYYDFFIQQFF
jgi:hypothetical protein